MESARVLLVDDEDSIRTGLSLALSRRGYEVRTCDRGLPALVEIRAAHHRGEPYRYVVLDVHLPDIDGLQLLHAIKTSYPDTPVLVISGYGDESVTRTVAGIPGSGFLDKPFAPRELMDALQDLTQVPPAPPPRQREERTPQALHATAYGLVRLAPTADSRAVAARIEGLEGVCYCERVEGRWDLVVLAQALDRSSLERRIGEAIEDLASVATLELLHLRQPLVEPGIWSIVVDSVGATPRLLDEPANGPQPARDAFVVLEVEPEHLAEVWVRARLTARVVQCDATRDRSHLVLLVTGWTGEGDPLRVPDRLRLLPGVLRARALPVAVDWRRHAS